MSEDFDILPLAIAFQNDNEITISFTNPNLQKTIPTWGKECWWTDPPPADCETNLCQFGKNKCIDFLGNIDVLSNSLKSSQNGKFVEGTDPNDFPPHLLPLIKIIDRIAKENSIDLAVNEFKGLTINFHK
jgi:hypothetical protein